MKILVVTHRYPPDHCGGAELYAHRMAKELAVENEVIVLTTDDGLARRNYSRRTFVHEGIRVIEVANQRRYTDFSDSYADPRMEKIFGAVLKAERPAIVHFQHLLHHSSRLPLIAWDFSVPSVATLHEYWMLCGRNGQMLRYDGERCEKPGLDRCAPCMARFHWGRRGLDVWALRGIASVKSLTGIDFKARARKIRLGDKIETDDEELEEETNHLRGELLLREASMRDAFESVTCWISPSEFLRERFIAAGFDGERIAVSELGVEDLPDDWEAPERGRDAVLRLGFVGSVQPVKGVHVLVEALEQLSDLALTVDIIGDIDAKPEYVNRLRAAEVGLQIHGRVAPEDVPLKMRELDILVVPSVWWENSPLVILEAQLQGLPVLASDIGGMAELVDEGRNGLLFPVESAEGLASLIRRLADDREALHALCQPTEENRSLAKDARFHQRLFEQVLSFEWEGEED